MAPMAIADSLFCLDFNTSIRSHALEQAGFGAQQRTRIFLSAYSELDQDITWKKHLEYICTRVAQ